jgi:hypothetical protein
MIDCNVKIPKSREWMVSEFTFIFSKQEWGFGVEDSEAKWNICSIAPAHLAGRPTSIFLGARWTATDCPTIAFSLRSRRSIVRRLLSTMSTRNSKGTRHRNRSDEAWHRVSNSVRAKSRTSRIWAPDKNFDLPRAPCSTPNFVNYFQWPDPVFALTPKRENQS